MLKLDERCVEQVWRGWHKSRCSRKMGHGPEGKYCKQHDPVLVAEKQEVRSELYKKDLEVRRIKFHGPKFLEALVVIAEGHNDPGALAREVIKEFKERK